MRALLLVMALAAPQAPEAEVKVVEYLKTHAKAGERIVVSQLYNEVFTAPAERAALNRLFNTFFKLPLYMAQYQKAAGKPPTLAEISEQSAFHVPGEADLMLRIMESDPRMPNFIRRHPQNGEVVIVDVERELAHPRFGKALERAQMKANNGLFIVDDFGRQRVSPSELLNRWVVPLDRRIDFLTFAGGRKIEIPFDLFVVFATNLEPAKMVDEAFLRRVQTKIKVDFISPEQFCEILRRICLEYSLKYDAAVANDLIQIIGEKYKEPLRACYPRDIIQQRFSQQHATWK